MLENMQPKVNRDSKAVGHETKTIIEKMLKRMKSSDELYNRIVDCCSLTHWALCHLNIVVQKVLPAQKSTCPLRTAVSQEMFVRRERKRRWKWPSVAAWKHPSSMNFFLCLHCHSWWNVFCPWKLKRLLLHIEYILDVFNNMPLQNVGLGMFIVSKSHFLPKEMLQRWGPMMSAWYRLAILPPSQRATHSPTGEAGCRPRSSHPAMHGWQRSDLKPSSGVLFLPR